MCPFLKEWQADTIEQFDIFVGIGDFNETLNGMRFRLRVLTGTTHTHFYVPESTVILINTDFLVVANKRLDFQLTFMAYYLWIHQLAVR